MKDFVVVYKKRTDMRDSNRLIIQTASGKKKLENVKAVSFVNGKECPCRIEKNDRSSLNYVYIDDSMGNDGEYDLIVDLPDEECSCKIVLSNGASTQTIKVSKASINYLRRTMEYHVDSIRRDGNEVRVTGWCASNGTLSAVCETSHGKISATVDRYARENIMRLYLPGELNSEVGFSFVAGGKDEKVPDSFVMVLRDNNRIIKRKIYVETGKLSRILNKFGNFMYKLRIYLAMYGFGGFVKKAFNKLFSSDEISYMKYFKKHYPDNATLKLQRETKFENSPLFSIVMPVFRPNEVFFKKMLDSVCNQTYANWQVCLADGGGEGHYMEQVVKNYQSKYGKDKICYIKLKDNLGIAANTNEALKAAKGDYIVFGDHDDEFHPSALYEVVSLINEHPDAEFIYTDEDKVVGNTGKHVTYHFKPDFNREMLNHTNYICHMVTVKRSLFERVGFLDSEFDGAQDYDFVLRCSENTDAIYHIPKILYYWRIHAGSTAAAPSAKDYAFVAGRRALAKHFERCGVNATVDDGVVPGYYGVTYHVDSEELISVIIPNKDHIDDLTKCIDSIEEKSEYRNLEYIVVENNSVENDTNIGYDTLKKKYADRIKIVNYGNGPFNYSAINNFGVKHASGNVYFFLNNDTELLVNSSIKDMYAILKQKNVGIVGAKLLYDDNTVQHAGVVLGFLGVAGHAFVGIPDEDYGYFARAVIPQDVTAVTAAAMLVRKEAYDKAGGFDPELKVSFNDIDFCMKVGKCGYRIIYDANAKFYHYESKSRGSENSPEKIARFNSEITLFLDRYEAELRAGDPYYNCNFSLNTQTYKLRK